MEQTKPHFRVSPRVLGPLGAEQLHDPALAVLELIKNSWDADATKVIVSVEETASKRRIAVIDNGHGMSRDDFEHRWLVIGTSQKRGGKGESEKGRPLIGEKGLGRLATFALGRTIKIESSRKPRSGFSATVNWESLRNSPSLEDYEVEITTKRRAHAGTRVEIQDLTSPWTDHQTDFLVTHAEFLASIPGERFAIELRVNGKRFSMEDPLATVSRLAEAELEMQVRPDGTPEITQCTVNNHDKRHILFRDLKEEWKDASLAGLSLTLAFFRRDEAARRLGDVLERNEVTEVLERYQGIRIFRDGINVPPYGLSQDDWAGLEKQRTSTGGPTLVPGNSQLVGELHVSRKLHPHLVITAGRSGFSDQTAVASLANYVRWAVRELGTARRADYLGISGADTPVPARIDDRKSEASGHKSEFQARVALAQVTQSKAVRSNPKLLRSVQEASKAVEAVLDESQQTLRLYAQLASTGIAATSFAHELRAEFDVISEALDELGSGHRKPDKELLKALNESWARLRAFAALFKVIPVKLRRQRKVLSSDDLARSTESVLGLATPDLVTTESKIPPLRLNVVPAELDAILLNLVSNAVKAIAASPNRSNGRIRIDMTGDGPDLRLLVADNGVGISQKVASVMFRPLEGQFAEGTGMGLPIVKFIAERYKGGVSVVSEPPKGFKTQFCVVLRAVVEK